MEGERVPVSALRSDQLKKKLQTSPKPTKISKFGFTVGRCTTKASATSIKLGSRKPEETVPTLAPKSLSVAAAFDDDEDSEPEESPPEAKMRTKNTGRDTPTVAGPNSFSKGEMGFLITRSYESKI